jgi:hypothetical protein
MEEVRNLEVKPELRFGWVNMLQPHLVTSKDKV